MSSLVPLEELGKQPQCLNCEAPRSEIFCQRCGQRHVTKRLSAKSMIRELPARLFSLERGLLFTVVNLWRSPGKIALNYVHGQRARYASPLAIFLIAASIQLVSLSFLAPHVRAQLAASIDAQQADPESAENFAKLETILGADPAQAIGEIWISTMNQGYTYAAFLFFCLPLAGLLSVVHRRGPAPYLLGEHLVFAVFTVSQLLIGTAITNLITVHINSAVQLSASMLLYFGYLILAHRAFYPPGAGSLVRTLAAFTLSVMVFFSSLVGVFAVTFAIHLFRLRP